ncbi:unnamed protein product, partial [Mesorhabditis belari]|uniref:LisH domain-containing protein n=1 Tax=Mesorhabditis belari TaxID=2138241 RepID=A0AAF3JAY2_9BILA
MSFSSDELNLLVFRYLLEAGFEHTAFVFAAESRVSQVETSSREIPHAALIKILQRGMFYAESELISMVPNANEASQVLKERLTLFDAAQEKEVLRHKMRDVAAAAAELSIKAEDGPSTSNDNQLSATSNDSQKARDRQARNDRQCNTPKQNGVSKKGFAKIKQEVENSPNGVLPVIKKQMAASMAYSQGTNGVNGNEKGKDLNLEHIEIEKSRVRMFKKHLHEVFICSWSPKEDVLASGSGDSTARIWNLQDCEDMRNPDSKYENGYLFKHYLGVIQQDQKPANKDVTSIDWHRNGGKIATGCYDGFARIWDTTNGQLHSTLGAHKGPIFALRWNPSGDLVLSAGVDKSTIVWDPIKSQNKQQFQFHSASALDVDWISDDTFASCSTDQTINVCRVGCDRPIRTYTGHASEVNAVRFDSFSKRLASCSDDMSIKIWSLTEDEPVHTFKQHSREIYTIRWSPQGSILASASFDTTVRVWDGNEGREVAVLHRHTDPVYSVAFGPNGKFIASGSFDRSVIVWDVNMAQPVTAWKGNKEEGGVFEVAFNRTGEKLAACTSDGALIIMDIRFLKRGHDGTIHPLHRINTSR